MATRGIKNSAWPHRTYCTRLSELLFDFLQYRDVLFPRYNVPLQLSQINERLCAIEVKLDISFRCYAKIHPRQLKFRLTTLERDTDRTVLVESRGTKVLFVPLCKTFSHDETYLSILYIFHQNLTVNCFDIWSRISSIFNQK